MNCPHCGEGVKLIRKPNGSYKCPRCGCRFRLTITYWTPKCFAKHHPNYGKEEVTLKEIRKKKRKSGKHGRKRKM